MKIGNEPRYEHLDSSDVEKLKKSINESQQWLDHTRDILLSVKPNMSSPIKAGEIIMHRKSFEAVVQPVMNKPKPKPPSPKKEEVVPENNVADNKDGQQPEGSTTDTSNPEQPKEMDVE